MQQAAYDELNAALNRILSSQPACPGDGNMDGLVDQKDLSRWQYFVNLSAENRDDDPNYNSSVFDFDHDGLTDKNDRAVIEQNLGGRCP